ncbi:DUF2785 domain-containing protein [Undibacterium flavidum]|uniref:DUF2785 domain-containing protein n=1 Tax=Undibacterium flavidum TaxID=2762297 RepID=A0ABR6YE43_9BURK|nr:DUF2785 domain-containing protein [Undibacterium flavidum]MBC3874812.1 DUF2785 domain-containing protein [Undibacterium flavidum]
MKPSFQLSIASLLLACGAFTYSSNSIAACPPVGRTQVELQALKTNQWQIADPQQRQQTALALVECLADTNPVLRDEIAFEALSFWMRSELLTTATIQTIRLQLLQQIRTPVTSKDQGFAHPFAALVLAEIARVDRRKAFMNDEQRQDMLNAAAEYLPAVRDFRGFDEQSGWRHGVAHGADWMLQLSINPALNQQQHLQILNALAPQIRNDQHFYHYGESERLMAPVFYLGLRSGLSAEEWERWFNSLFTTSLDPKLTTQASLARKHNLTAFLYALYVNLQETQVTAAKEKLLPHVIKSLKKLN